MKYLVKFIPLERYAFGTDQSFKYQGVENMAKETYFVRSKKMPEQTTILGALRYLLLQSEGLLKADFHYTAEEKQKMNELIGPESFSFGSDKKQDFGVLYSISPVFLVDADNNGYVKNPFHNKAQESGYEPMKIEEKVYHTSSGVLKFPKLKEYDAKEGYAGGYYCLNDQKIVSEGTIFESNILTGNRKNSANDTDEDGYFKREVYALKNGFSFGVYVEAEHLPKSGIVFMGQKKSAFKVCIEETADEELVLQVQKAFTGGKEWFYAVSDLVVTEAPAYDSFCIVEQKKIQNLETVYNEKNHTRRLRKSQRQYNLVQSGSVFLEQCTINVDNENHRQIGYNHIVKIGGEQL